MPSRRSPIGTATLAVSKNWTPVLVFLAVLSAHGANLRPEHEIANTIRKRLPPGTRPSQTLLVKREAEKLRLDWEEALPNGEHRHFSIETQDNPNYWRGATKSDPEGNLTNLSRVIQDVSRVARRFPELGDLHFELGSSKEKESIDAGILLNQRIQMPPNHNRSFERLHEIFHQIFDRKFVPDISISQEELSRLMQSSQIGSFLVTGDATFEPRSDSDSLGYKKSLMKRAIVERLDHIPHLAQLYDAFQETYSDLSASILLGNFGLLPPEIDRSKTLFGKDGQKRDLWQMHQLTARKKHHLASGVHFGLFFDLAQVARRLNDPSFDDKCLAIINTTAARLQAYVMGRVSEQPAPQAPSPFFEWNQLLVQSMIDGFANEFKGISRTRLEEAADRRDLRIRNARQFWYKFYRLDPQRALDELAWNSLIKEKKELSPVFYFEGLDPVLHAKILSELPSILIEGMETGRIKDFDVLYSLTCLNALVGNAEQALVVAESLAARYPDLSAKAKKVITQYLETH